MTDKNRIAATFAAAAQDYDVYAVLQRHAAQELAERVIAHWPQLSRIVEIGCGTGNLTERLAQAYAQADILATDIAPAMLDACRARVGHRVRYAVTDGEYSDCRDADLAVSSLAFQWFADQEAALLRLSAQVPRFAVATLLDGTFAEWKAAHARLGLEDGVRDFMSEAAMRGLCARIGARCEFETIREHYPDALQFVRSVKAIGAGTPRGGHRPAPLRRVLKEFPDGITVSYRLAYVLMERKE